MTLAQRTFREVHQQDFASASGDWNPMHMDAMLSRRTQAGAPVVHGVHLLLWSLDALAEARPHLPPARKIRGQFYKFVYVDEPAQTLVAQEKPKGIRLNVAVGSSVRTRVHVEFGDELEDSFAWTSAAVDVYPRTVTALDLPFETLQDRTGLLALATGIEAAANLFPFATRWLGAEAVAALMASTQLVGMVIPGLHSIYSELTVHHCLDAGGKPFLAFRVQDADPRFRTVDLEISGGGLVGTINSVARTPPVEQISIKGLAGRVAPGQFAGAVALIVGGSRGLGELTAKMIAAGGGKPIITWSVGQADAEKVASEIRAAGYACDTLAYDARKEAAPQLASLATVPTHLYYFATPAIFRAQAEAFAPQRLREFLAVYVEGFFDLVHQLVLRGAKPSVFYPSSVAVTQRPEGMLEYAMAKSAGELLCEELSTSMPSVRITTVRLPRLPTDQTATVAEVETADPVDTMLPIIETVQSQGGGSA